MIIPTADITAAPRSSEGSGRRMPRLSQLPGFRKQSSHINRYLAWKRPRVPVFQLLVEAFAGPHAPAKLANQLLYWTVDDDGLTRMGATSRREFWIVKADYEWKREIDISERSVSAAKKVLVERELVRYESRKSGLYDGAPTSHYQIQFEPLLRMLAPASLRRGARLARDQRNVRQGAAIIDIAEHVLAGVELADYVTVDDELAGVLDGTADDVCCLISRVEAELTTVSSERLHSSLAASASALKGGLGRLAEWPSTPQPLRDRLRNRCGDLYTTTTSTSPMGTPSKTVVEVPSTLAPRQGGDGCQSGDGAFATPVVRLPGSDPSKGPVRCASGVSRGDGVTTAPASYSTGNYRTPALSIPHPIDLLDTSIRGAEPHALAPGDAVEVNVASGRDALRDDFLGAVERAVKMAPRREVGETETEFEGRRAKHERRLRGVAYEAVRDAFALQPHELGAAQVRKRLDRLAVGRGLEETVRLVARAAAIACGAFDQEGVVDWLDLIVAAVQAGIPVDGLPLNGSASKDSSGGVEGALRTALSTRYDRRVNDRSLVQVVAEVCGLESEHLYRLINACVKMTRSAGGWDRSPFVEALVEAALGGRRLSSFLFALVRGLDPTAADQVDGYIRWLHHAGDTPDIVWDALDEYVGSCEGRGTVPRIVA